MLDHVLEAVAVLHMVVHRVGALAQPVLAVDVQVAVHLQRSRGAVAGGAGQGVEGGEECRAGCWWVSVWMGVPC